MASSASVVLNSAPGGAAAIQIKNAVTIYAGSLCSYDGTSGRLKPYDGTIGDRLAGWATGEPQQQGRNSLLGDTSATDIPRAKVDFGGPHLRLNNIAVTGVTAVTDAGKPVYATDDNTYTLTDPTTHRVQVGYVIGLGKSGSGYADIQTSYINGTLGV